MGHIELLIAKPKNLGDNHPHKDIRVFYTLLEEVCEELGITYKIYPSSTGRLTQNHNPQGGSLCWHTRTDKPFNGLYHLKKGYLNGLMYFDKMGYSGWSALAQKYDEPEILTTKMKNLVDLRVQTYINNNESKFIQPNIKVTKRDYILVLHQMPRDTVSQLAYIRTEDLLGRVRKALQGRDEDILIKTHPRWPGKGTIDGSIHEVIKHAKAIYTVNSGAGFEALMQHKRVFVAGNCDYKWAAHTVKSVADIRNTAHLIDEPVNTEKIYKFLYHCFYEYFLNTYDKEAIKERVQKVIAEMRYPGIRETERLT